MGWGRGSIRQSLVKHGKDFEMIFSLYSLTIASLWRSITIKTQAKKKKKKNPLGYKKKDGEERESNSLEMLRAEAIMSPAAWCDPGELGPQRVSDRCWCSWAVRTISQRMPRP